MGISIHEIFDWTIRKSLIWLKVQMKSKLYIESEGSKFVSMAVTQYFM